MQLIFVGDPMCSWCYGFAKELAAALEADSTLELEIVLGGLRAGGTELLDDAAKQFRLSHWQRVEAASGVPFNRAAFLARQDFLYDTEPICRAVVAARRLAPQGPLLEVFRALQRAFYVEGLDTTAPSTLTRVIAESLRGAGFDVTPKGALQVFEATQTIAEAQADFAKARLWGINSFPALLARVGEQLHVVTPGFRTASEIGEAVAAIRTRFASSVPG